MHGIGGLGATALRHRNRLWVPTKSLFN